MKKHWIKDTHSFCGIATYNYNTVHRKKEVTCKKCLKLMVKK